MNWKLCNFLHYSERVNKQARASWDAALDMTIYLPIVTMDIYKPRYLFKDRLRTVGPGLARFMATALENYKLLLMCERTWAMVGSCYGDHGYVFDTVKSEVLP